MSDEIDSKLRGIIAQCLKIDETLIEDKSSLSDWGGDSLDFIEAIFQIETQFDISLPELGGGQDLDFEKLANMVKEKISQKSS